MKDLVKLIKDENYNKGPFENNDEKLNVLINHSKDARKTALELCSKLNNITESDKRLIEIAALVHDIKKWTGFKHNRNGSDYILEEFNYGYKENKLIALMVMWHKENGYEKILKGKKLKMVEIVRVADKISKLYKVDENKLDSEYIIARGKVDRLVSKDVKREAYKILNNTYRKIKKMKKITN